MLPRAEGMIRVVLVLLIHWTQEMRHNHFYQGKQEGNPAKGDGNKGRETIEDRGPSLPSFRDAGEDS